MMDRRHPVEPFDPDRFRGYFGTHSDHLTADLFPGGACNSNYLVTSPGGPRVVCRIHRRGDPIVERNVTRLVRDAITTPDYLWTGKGVSVISFVNIGNLLRHLSPAWEAPLAAGLADEGFELPADWRCRAALIDLASHPEFLTSERSREFKRSCVRRIEEFLESPPPRA